MCALIALVGCDETFRVVPAGGSLTLSAGAVELDAGTTTTIAVCGSDSDGISVPELTQILIGVSEGSLDGDAGPALERLQVPTDELGCVDVGFVAPSRATTVTVTASSGSVVADDETITVEDVARHLEAWVTPAELGPDGGEVTVNVRILGVSDAPVDGAMATVRASYAAPTGSVVTTGADGSAQTRLQLTRTDSISIIADGLPDEPQEYTVVTAAPEISRVVPAACFWVEGAALEINGRDFSGGATVTVDGRAAQVSQRSATVLEVELPALVGEPGPVHLVVDNGYDSVATAEFTYEAVPDPVVEPSACGGTP
ncbi:MAG: IPT/TIG domain-containing protein [Alphaproteobacteria bacterium]|nr:IPT/TIG domain-containing protein [Alphaproteobacteria bacterium]